MSISLLTEIFTGSINVRMFDVKRVSPYSLIYKKNMDTLRGKHILDFHNIYRSSVYVIFNVNLRRSYEKSFACFRYKTRSN